MNRCTLTKRMRSIPYEYGMAEKEYFFSRNKKKKITNGHIN